MYIEKNIFVGIHTIEAALNNLSDNDKATLYLLKDHVSTKHKNLQYFAEKKNTIFVS
jgi:hypothetical protein